MMSTTVDGEDNESKSSETDTKSGYQDSEYMSQESSNLSPPINYQRQKPFKTSSKIHYSKTGLNKFHVKEMDE